MTRLAGSTDARAACLQAVRRGVIRFLVLIIDASQKMNERDMRPHRLGVVQQVNGDAKDRAQNAAHFSFRHDGLCLYSQQQ